MGRGERGGGRAISSKGVCGHGGGMKFKPMGDRLLVRRDKAATESRGGIIIPDDAKQREASGTVLAIVAGKWLSEAKQYQRPEAKGGDRPCFNIYDWRGDDFHNERTLD